MQVILLEKIDNLGDLGDQVKVKSGYGRNYLIPSGKAAPATQENVAKFEARRAELQQIAGQTLVEAQARGEALQGLSVSIAAKAGDEGKLYGSVGTGDIAHAITEAGVAIERHEVRMPTGPFRELGEYTVDIHLHADVTVAVGVAVVAE
ncbi:MAG: 50S ribosomal protein L9 [Gammaproteobacteria bacterium]